MDIRADDLARELRVSVPELLQDANDLLDREFRRGGHAAIEGMTTRTVQDEQTARVTISEKLADHLRAGE